MRRLDRPLTPLLCVLSLLVCACERQVPTQAPVPDDPARRIVTLAPHLAELVFASGAGELLVGVSAYSDFPNAVSDIPRVGDAFLVDQERLALLEPDLILAWHSGTPASTVEELRRQGYRVEEIHTQRLADIATALREVGRLTGQVDRGRDVARSFEQQIAELASQHAGSDSVRVFYQVSERPLYTVSGAHFVSELIELCGGENVFSDLGELAPMVSEEAVLARDPEAFLAGGAVDGSDPETFTAWRRWEELAANRYDNFFIVDANTIARPTPRLVQAGEQICERLQDSRINRRTASEAMTSSAR